MGSDRARRSLGVHPAPPGPAGLCQGDGRGRAGSANHAPRHSRTSFPLRLIGNEARAYARVIRVRTSEIGLPEQVTLDKEMFIYSPAVRLTPERKEEGRVDGLLLSGCEPRVGLCTSDFTAGSLLLAPPLPSQEELRHP